MEKYVKTRFRGGVLRAVAVTAAGVLVALGGAAGAGAVSPSASRPVIDPDASGSLTIHKYVTPDEDLDLPSDGMDHGELTGLDPLPDVTFTVKQVLGYDLTTNAGWAAASTLDPDTAAEGDFGVVREVTTTAAGTAVATGLPVGVYLVTETVYPAGTTPANPFLITVPLTNPTNDAEWVYDVHVYPKNAVTTATKTVDDSSAVSVGDTVTWTILADIPDVAVIDGYKITDRLDTKLDHVSTAVTLENGGTLDAGDYQLGFDPTTRTVTVLFTPSGLGTLVEHSRDRVQVVITTTVNAIGEIANEALVFPNLPSFEIEPGEPGGPTVTPEVESKWGNVTLLKVAEDGGALLPGAEFAVYLSRADAVSGTGAIRSGTTGADGSLTFTGLRYSGWADGASVAPGEAGYQSYWIVETKAPDGFELLAAPIEVVVDSGDQLVDYTIENVATNAGFTLPLTGGTGTVVITAAGLLLLTGAALLAFRARRRETARA
ncbi:SpaH/EbpB family LPXTG-anchored major pilin [Cellulomonas hominis]|nr:SpaH/EbpB family LPXTG-anchored major pilin [Cellulomonas hominis]